MPIIAILLYHVANLIHTPPLSVIGLIREGDTVSGTLLFLMNPQPDSIGIDRSYPVPHTGFRTLLSAQGCNMARLDVRLDSERRRRLEELVEERGVPISDVVRCLIDDAYEDIVRVRRKQAVERLIELNVEDPPDPDTLSRELEAAHEPGGLH